MTTVRGQRIDPTVAVNALTAAYRAGGRTPPDWDPTPPDDDDTPNIRAAHRCWCDTSFIARRDLETHQTTCNTYQGHQR